MTNLLTYKGTDYPPIPEPKHFIKELRKLHRMESSKREGQMFRDFLAMAYYATSKRMAMARREWDLAEERESAYMQVVNTYRNKDVIRGYPKLMALAMTGADAGDDFLGIVGAELEVLDHRNGQYFTPMPVCMMMAEVMLSDRNDKLKREIESGGYVTIGEPAAGGGAMLIAAKRVLEYRGFEPMQHMLVHATELNQASYWMCYLQLTWCGIPGQVIHGNSLSLEQFDGEWTLPTLEFRKHHDTLFDKGKSDTHPETIKKPVQPEKPDIEISRTNQLPLFNFGEVS